MPASLVMFLVGMTVVSAGLAGQWWYRGRPLAAETGTVHGVVTAFRGPGMLAGREEPGEVTVRYAVAGQVYSIELDADAGVGDRTLRTGEQVAVEYDLRRPARARSAAEATAARADFRAACDVTALTALLAIAGTVGHLVGRRRTRRRLTGPPRIDSEAMDEG